MAPWPRLSWALLLGISWYHHANAQTAVDIPVEHDVGDGVFRRGGWLRQPLETDVLELHLDPLEGKQAASFKQLSGAGGFYRLRLPSDPSSPPGATKAVVASVRASCLAAAAAAATAAAATGRLPSGGAIPGDVSSLHLSLFSDPDGRIAAATFSGNAVGARCAAALEAGAAAAAVGGDSASPRLPSRLPVGLSGPQRAAQLTGRGPGAAAAAPGGPAGAGGAGGQPGSQAGPGGARPGAGGAGQGGGDGARPDERTWLQKNWVFLLPAVFIIINMMGQGLPQQEGAGGGTAPAAAAPGPRRR